MKPLNYAVLETFAQTNEADAELVMERLKPTYGGFRAFSRKNIVESLMTAAANGLLCETRCIRGFSGELRVFYRATDYGREMLANYL
ncbi:MAG: hypothetical protein LBU07_04075 [Coriobacteriales bacterium]|jgi:DNA-binding PadR family transcriptional regulator|nr:hypothetical protein [Coriobacteriales bacterium]